MSIVATIILGLLELAPNYFCYHRLVFAGTNIQFLLPSSFNFAGASVFFCYNRPSDLLEPVSVNQMFFLFATDEGERRRRATGEAGLATCMRERTHDMMREWAAAMDSFSMIFNMPTRGCEEDDGKMPSNGYAWAYPRVARRPAEFGPVDRRLSLPFKE